MQRYARAEEWHQVSPGRHLRGNSLDVHHVYLSRRIAETNGRITLKALHRELVERGWHGGSSALHDWAEHRLDQPRQTQADEGCGIVDRVELPSGMGGLRWARVRVPGIASVMSAWMNPGATALSVLGDLLACRYAGLVAT